jgi:two-component system response regulator GlrR
MLHAQAERSRYFTRMTRIIKISLPPLRERTCDIAELAQAFLRRLCSQMGRPPLKFTARAFQALVSYRWPGNVRELENVIQRAAILAECSVIDASDLELPDADRSTATAVGFEQAKRRAMDGFERDYLMQLLSEVSGNISRGAKLAGKDRRTFQRLLHKCNLHASDYHHKCACGIRRALRRLALSPRSLEHFYFKYLHIQRRRNNLRTRF